MKTNGDSQDHDARPRKRPGRVPVSCAECRRLKLRCDRKLPCGNCAKRGCAAICPDGALTTGKGNRMILANTEELHERIETLCVRVRKLEDALKALQATISTEPHPLLSGDLLLVKTPVRSESERQSSQSSSQSSPDPEEDETVFDSFGTLTIGLWGETNFLGQAARADFLLNDPDIEIEEQPRRLPPELYNYFWPEAPPTPNDNIRSLVYDYLPSLQEACALGEIYLERGKWLGTLIPRQELYDELIGAVYRPHSLEVVVCPHRLSLLFTVFALGSLWDLSRPPYSPEADNYYQLARVALTFKSPVHETTVAAVQTLVQMAQYLEYTDMSQANSQRWMIMGTAVKLASSMGLHHDSSRWHLDEKISRRRHAAFWHMYWMEINDSLMYGRPPSISDKFIDCPLPPDPDNAVNEDGKPQASYLRWSLKFGQLIRNVYEEAFGAKIPSYSTVLSLDMKLRDFSIPPRFVTLCPAGIPHEPPELVMQRWGVLYQKETILLQLHRSFLVQALAGPPEDLLTGKYAPSVMACYRSAYRIIEGLDSVYKQLPSLVTRVGCFFAGAVSSAIVMCLLATRSPTSSLAPYAMDKLEVMCDVLEKVSDKNRTARRNLEPTQKLRQRAHEALRRAAHERTVGVAPAAASVQGDELDRLDGKTRLVSKGPRLFGSGPAYGVAAEPGTMLASEDASPAADGGWTSDSAASVERLLGPTAAAFPHAAFEAFADAQPYEPPAAFAYGERNGLTLATSDPGPGLDATWHSFIQQLGF